VSDETVERLKKYSSGPDECPRDVGRVQRIVNGVAYFAMTAAISIRNVTKRFNGIVAVNDLDLTVPRGSLYGFIGANGSGKTTTLRMIMHILLADQGEIEVLGERDTRAARDRVSYLPEERGLYKRMTVRRLLRYYGSLTGARQPDLDHAITHWLDRLGLTDWIDKKVEALSKGMAQKVQFIKIS
jgi:ABC-2 type transport system ATP-binding protein